MIPGATRCSGCLRWQGRRCCVCCVGGWGAVSVRRSATAAATRGRRTADPGGGCARWAVADSAGALRAVTAWLQASCRALAGVRRATRRRRVGRPIRSGRVAQLEYRAHAAGQAGAEGGLEGGRHAVAVAVELGEACGREQGRPMVRPKSERRGQLVAASTRSLSSPAGFLGSVQGPAHSLRPCCTPRRPMRRLRSSGRWRVACSAPPPTRSS